MHEIMPNEASENTTETVANYSNTLTRDSPLKLHYTHPDPGTEFQKAPVARLPGTMVGSFVFHRVAGVHLDRRQGSQKKNWSLRRHDGLLLHVSCCPDPLCVFVRSFYMHCCVCPCSFNTQIISFRIMFIFLRTVF